MTDTITSPPPAAQAEDRAMNGARSAVETLAATGVEVCFANPGTSEMHFVSALDPGSGIRPVLCLFEGVATGAADGYARMKGKPASTLLHLGPGLANGLANLHNARKAQSPVVNIVGDHALTHQRFETPLTSDIQALARPVSHWVHSARSATTVAADVARAVQAACTHPGQIASLILPADTAWSPATGAAAPLPVPPAPAVGEQVLTRTADLLRSGRRIAFLLRGDALHGPGLQAAGRIAAATGARLISDTFTPRIQRGAGRVPVTRLPYRADDATLVLARFEILITVGTAAPVAFFAYPGKASELTPDICRPMVLAHPHEDGAEALITLADLIDAPPARTPHRAWSAPTAPAGGDLTALNTFQVLAHLLPEGAIVSDESVTAGFAGHSVLVDAAPHDHLNLTGGAIGQGMPLATGAALACPDRKVISLQGDGSAMYTPQALWTQARENLDVTTVIFANHSYRVLNQELTLLGANAPGPESAGLLELDRPRLDWVSTAQGMGVEATRVRTTSDLAGALRSAFHHRGPRLIEAAISAPPAP
ncbi:acetolactate synthase large subunit [Streptomyces sp. NPDC046915]|uniref:acetolactate synthase large subunit n=1 Tax=Streptomyces sp. NPDC046915 TaxID=3155257 RepID=UPI0033EF202B